MIRRERPLVPNTNLLQVDLTPLINELKMVATRATHNFSFNIVFNDSEIIPMFITGHEEEQDVPVFKHPTFFEVGGNKYFATDIRHLAKNKIEYDDIFTISTNKEAIETELVRLILTAKYYESAVAFNSINEVVATAMTQWLSKMIANITSLSLYEGLVIECIIAHYFNIMLMNPTDTLEEDKMIATHRVINQLGKQNKTFVENTVASFIETPATNINGLIEQLKKTNVKLKNFNLNSLLTIIGKSVIVPNSNFMIVSGLEHPPTMITLLHAALTHRVNGRSRLNLIIKKTRNMAKLVDFVRIKLTESTL